MGGASQAQREPERAPRWSGRVQYARRAPCQAPWTNIVKFPSVLQTLNEHSTTRFQAMIAM